MRLEITCSDRVGMGQKILGIFVEHDINVRGIEFNQLGRVFIDIPDLDFSALQQFMPQLRLLEGVGDVKTSPYMPSERQRNELATLVQTFPDPFISIDGKGNIIQLNAVAAESLGDNEEYFVGEPISSLIKGFNFSRWIDNDDVLAQTRRLKFQDEDFVADILPINVENDSGKQVFVGAVLILKSEMRLGEQMSAFKQPNDNEFSGIQSNSSAMRKVIREAKRMSLLDSAVLIVGETGTGKELLARACHASSDRAANPFMTLSCATLPDDAAETELFGSGSSGDSTAKRGLFELADGGSIFLDEVGEMSAKLQTKLLRVIQDGSFRRVDDEKEFKVNVRIICSTNKDLLNLVSLGEFREDLYYRLNVLGLNIPPLRDRRNDILPLAELFIVRSANKLGKSRVKLDDECREFVEHYPWPGNVRQLENVIIRAVSLMEGNVISIEHLHLPAYTREHGYLEQEFEGTLDGAVKNFEADLLRKLYPAYPSTRQLAKKLGLSHTAIANKLREYDINKKTVKI